MGEDYSQHEIAMCIDNKALWVDMDLWRRRDSNLLDPNWLHSAKPRHNHDTFAANPDTSRHLRQAENRQNDRTSTHPEQNFDSSLRPKYAICVSQAIAPNDLTMVVGAWLDLPDSARTAIVAIVQSFITSNAQSKTQRCDSDA